MGVSPPGHTGYEEEGTLHNANPPPPGGHRQGPAPGPVQQAPKDRDTHCSNGRRPQEPRALPLATSLTQSPLSSPLPGKQTHFRYFLQRELNTRGGHTTDRS